MVDMESQGYTYNYDEDYAKTTLGHFLVPSSSAENLIRIMDRYQGMIKIEGEKL